MRTKFRFPVLLVLSLCFAAIILPSLGQAQCCTGIRGNISNSGTIDLTDLALLIGYLTIPNMNLPCPEAANISGTGTIDLTDLAMLIGYLTIPNFVLPPCPADTGLMNPTTRMAAVTAVEHHADSLMYLPTATFNQRILTFLQGRKEFSAAGIDPSGNNVWARFTDGVLYMVAGSFGALDDSLPGEVLPLQQIPEAPPLTAEEMIRLRAATPRTTAGNYDDLPGSARFRVIRTVGNAFASSISTSNRLRSWLAGNGYINAGDGATVENLRAVGGEGVIFYVGHGGMGIQQNGNLDYGIWSSTLANVGNLASYTDDVVSGRLCLLSAPKDTTASGAPKNETHYGITSRFIQYYWADLAPNAMVVITACASDSIAAFRNAIQAKGGPAYFGWSRTLDCKGGCYAAEFLFDRCLGANKAFPRENPKQRPFDITKVFADLQSRNFHVQSGGDGVTTFTSTMRYHPGSSNYGLLAPSIQFMDLYAQSDTLTINGLFGEDPGANGQVTVNGAALTILSWSPTVIKCQMPLRGPGSSGPVIVEKKAPNSTDFRKSNIVNISEWEGTFVQTHHEGGSLQLSAIYNMRIRADIHSHRDEPGETPFKPITPYFQESDATGNWLVEGTGTWYDSYDDITFEYEWTGEGDLTLYGLSGPGSLNFFHYLGSVDADQHVITLALDAMVMEGFSIKQTMYITGFPPDVSNYPGGWATTADLELYDDVENFYYYTVILDNQFNIQPSTRTAAGSAQINNFGDAFHPALQMQWPAIPVSYPPDPNEAQ